LFEFGAVICRDGMSRAERRVVGLPLGAALFFVRVNQVLVRVWTRVMTDGPRGRSALPLSGLRSDRVVAGDGGAHGSAASGQTCVCMCVYMNGSIGRMGARPVGAGRLVCRRDLSDLC
jgi:hypothetical protein